MDGKFKLSYNKKKKKFDLEFNFSKTDFIIVLIVKSLVDLLTNENFLRFVVEIVKLILNGSFYYFINNSFFVCKEIKYES